MTLPSDDNSVRSVADQALGRLAAGPIGGYHAAGDSASEPTAWAALALSRAGLADAAQRATDWLAEHQSADGSVGVNATEAEPGWPTALAMIAWQALDPAGYKECIRRGAKWALAQKPWTAPRDPNTGHDTTLEGWSWAPETHSWLEPTAFFAVALRRAGYIDHPRRKQAVALMVDRLLSGGGANYGNTTVLGQELLQHIQPSGIVAWALSEETVTDPRLPRTLKYLNDAITAPTGVASLCWAVRGLAAYRVATDSVAEKLAAAWPRVERSESKYKTALFALAAQEVLSEATPNAAEPS